MTNLQAERPESAAPGPLFGKCQSLRADLLVAPDVFDEKLVHQSVGAVKFQAVADREDQVARRLPISLNQPRTTEFRSIQQALQGSPLALFIVAPGFVELRHIAQDARDARGG